MSASAPGCGYQLHSGLCLQPFVHASVHISSVFVLLGLFYYACCVRPYRLADLHWATSGVIQAQQIRYEPGLLFVLLQLCPV